jgi:hypothetical protein
MQRTTSPLTRSLGPIVPEGVQEDPNPREGTRAFKLMRADGKVIGQGWLDDGVDELGLMDAWLALMWETVETANQEHAACVAASGVGVPSKLGLRLEP